MMAPDTPGPKTYEIIENGRAIRCLLCGRVSHNANDVLYLYCGNCHRFHFVKAHHAVRPG